ncbi:hypothetical protein Tsubulata_020255 [Turnera subulata]|uniref:SANT domain-containing protein n=1 Tax=Turnera subulata TaxID=218843 RepID=A0A9Q0GGX8_9ROSI|nr:hypothetical protein Tsubulata_020255 [Turnera subulata]
MPPEPLPWDRKEFYKERKHDRPDTPSFGSNHPRWRDYSSSSSNHYTPYHRWGGGGSSNDFRRPPGHGKQGGWHMFGEESGHMYAPYRYSDRMMGDENFRPSVSRGEGRYGGRNSRDNRGSFGPRDWKGHSWEMSNGSSNAPGRLHDVSNDQRQVDGMLGYPPSQPPHSDFVNTWDQIHMKDQHDNNKMAGVNGLGAGQKGDDRGNNLEWRPVKWTRSGSMGSRGSGFSHSSSSKSLGGVDSNEGKTELQKKNATPVQSPSGDVATCVTSTLTSEDMMSRKKPRLGWGEGLAKYEKKKVEGPDVTPNKDGPLVCASNVEPNHSQSSNLAERSPVVNGFSECLSPATPSSVACSSSPGLEEKTSGKSLNVDNDVGNVCASPSVGSQSHSHGLSFSLEKMDANSIPNLGSSLAELLQYDEASVVDSNFLRTSAMNKLLIWKGDISKALEVTESEIDMLENELKSMRVEYGSRSSLLEAPSSFPAQDSVKTCNEVEVGSNSIVRPPPLQVVSCEDEIVEKVSISDGDLEGIHADKDDEIDSPGTATSKFIEPISLTKTVSVSDVDKHGECDRDSGAAQSTDAELKGLVSCMDKEESVPPNCPDDKLLMESTTAASLTDVSAHANGDDDLCNLILVSNKESAARAAEVFDKLLPRDQCKIDFGQVTSVSSGQSNSSVKEKFARRKLFIKFQERIVTLKFKAFQHLWKEDMRLLSVRKYRAKSQKKCEASLRITHGGYQKHRSSIRSRFASPAGNLSLVPTAEILSFASKLLSESQVKNYRSVLKMPALILDEKERLASCFVSNNGLVEDPCAVEKERAMINPWTSEEREIFMDKLATFGKDFRKIAAFLDHKSTADCVEFYYKNHKSDSFEKTKKSKESKTSTNYLVASNKKWSRDMNAASLDILGAASVMAADADNAIGGRKFSGRIYFGGYRDSKTTGTDGILERPTQYDAFVNEKETAAADVLAGICGSLSSEAISSCITTSVDLVEGYRERKCQKVDSVKRPSTSDVTQNVDEETCSDDSCGETDSADWTDEEKSIFIRAVSSYGKDFAMISRCVRTRSRDQCKVFFSKARKCLGLDLLHPAPGHSGTPVSDDVNGGGSDMDDACAIEMGSATCNEKLRCKVDEDLPLPVANSKHDESTDVERIHLHTDLNKVVDNSVMEMSDRKDSKMVEASVSDPCQESGRPGLTVDVNSQTMNMTEIQKMPVSSVRGQAIVESVSIGNAVEVVTSNSHGNGIGDHLVGSKLFVPENSSSGQSSDKSIAAQHPVNVVDKEASVLNYPGKPSIESFPHVPPSSVMATEFTFDKKDNQDRFSSTLDLQDCTDKQGETSAGRDDFLQHLSAHSVLGDNGSSQILRGYPLQMPTTKEMNGDISCRNLSEVHSLPDLEARVASQFVAQDSFLKKCNSSKARSVAELPKEHSQSMPNTEKPCRNGDVKLFGKILNNPSPAQNHSSNELEEKVSSNSKSGSKSCSMKATAHHYADGNTTVLKGDPNNFLGHENGPMRNYGLWDGNRIQTGYPPFPDSTYLLAKYPAAFSNYHGSSPKMQHQAFQTVVKGNQCNLNGISVFPPREVCGSSGVVDYQMYRGHEGGKVQPFTLDTNPQRDDVFSEMQRLNGQQGRSVVGINGVSRGGMVVGGPCAGVSDPVAAITMHFAKNGGQNGAIIREEESWRGKGDIGR